MLRAESSPRRIREPAAASGLWSTPVAPDGRSGGGALERSVKRAHLGMPSGPALEGGRHRAAGGAVLQLHGGERALHRRRCVEAPAALQRRRRRRRHGPPGPHCLLVFLHTAPPPRRRGRRVPVCADTSTRSKHGEGEELREL